MTMTLSLIIAAVLAGVSASSAQTPRTASFAGSDWGFFLMETGAAMEMVRTGQPSLGWQQPEAIINIVSRDGRPLTEADRDLAADLARRLCERTGRRFNTQARGHWLRGGALGFNGACTQW